MWGGYLSSNTYFYSFCLHTIPCPLWGCVHGSRSIYHPFLPELVPALVWLFFEYIHFFLFACIPPSLSYISLVCMSFRGVISPFSPQTCACSCLAFSSNTYFYSFCLHTTFYPPPFPSFPPFPSAIPVSPDTNPSPFSFLPNLYLLYSNIRNFPIQVHLAVWYTSSQSPQTIPFIL